MMVARGNVEWGELGEGTGAIVNGDEKRLDLGWGTHNTIYR